MVKLCKLQNGINQSHAYFYNDYCIFYRFNNFNFCLVKSLTRFLAKQAVNIRKITQYQLLTAIKAYDPKMADIIYKHLKEEWRSLDVDQNQ